MILCGLEKSKKIFARLIGSSKQSFLENPEFIQDFLLCKLSGSFYFFL